MPTSLPADLLGRCRFPAEDVVDLAVSGGADSLALLALATQAGKRVTAHHVDHGIRPGSAEEAEVVRHAAAAVGADFVGHAVVVEPGPDLEARARSARYEVLPRGVLTGHTADDQAETVVINLMRGASIDGLSAMRPATRPLLNLRRSETHALCRELGWQPVHDESNDDPRFLRNRVRHDVMPLLEKVAERDLVPLLLRQAALMADDVSLLDALAAEVDPTDAKALANSPVAIARRAVRSWLRGVLDDELHPPDLAAVERVLAVARGEAVACDVSGGWEVRRSSQRLNLQRKN